jgi:hypothetical protein
MYYGRGSTPIPDPTVLTNQAVAQATDTLRRELLSAVAVLDARLNGQHDPVQTRLQAMDQAIELVAVWREELPTRMDGRVRQLELLLTERFNTVEVRFDAIAGQFKERDTRSERESRDNKVAVDAAFAAQKEAASEQNKSNTLAISKSEAATSETLNKQADLFKSTTDALGARIEDAKQALGKIDTRLTAIESRGVQVRETQGQSNWAIGAAVSAFALLISLAGLIVVLIKLG